MSPSGKPGIARWPGLLALLALGGACDCDGGAVTAPTTLISAAPRRLDFGRVYVGSEARQVVNLGSIGTASLRYQAQFGADAEGFLAGPANAQIAAGGTLELDLLPADATSRGPHSAHPRT